MFLSASYREIANIPLLKLSLSGDINIVFNLIQYMSPKPGPQSRALCGTVCALSIAVVLYKIVNLLILFILFINVLYFST